MTCCLPNLPVVSGAAQLLGRSGSELQLEPEFTRENVPRAADQRPCRVRHQQSRGCSGTSGAAPSPWEKGLYDAEREMQTASLGSAHLCTPGTRRARVPAGCQISQLREAASSALGSLPWRASRLPAAKVTTSGFPQGPVITPNKATD